MSCSKITNCQSDCGGSAGIFPRVQNNSYLINLNANPSICPIIPNDLTVAFTGSYILTPQNIFSNIPVSTFYFQNLYKTVTGLNFVNYYYYVVRLHLTSCHSPSITPTSLFAKDFNQICANLVFNVGLSFSYQVSDGLNITETANAFYGLSPYVKYDPSEIMTLQLICIQTSNGTYPQTINIIPL